MNAEERIRQERSHFPGVNGQAYFLNAATGLIPDYIYKAVRRYEDDRYYRGGDSVWGDGMNTWQMLPWAREKLGKMLGCPGVNIAFGENSSRLLNLFINGIGLQDGDNVILMRNSFVGGRYAWEMKRREGVELRYISDENGVVTPESIFAAADERTKAIFVCHVESTTGFRHDLSKIGDFCREREIWFLVDAVQSAGVLPIDIEAMKIDCLVGNDYKWMMHYCGTGYGYFSNRLLSVMGEKMAGWFAVEDRVDMKQTEMRLRKGAERLEIGYPHTPGIYALGLAAERYLELGAANIEQYVRKLRKLLEAGIQKLPNAELCYDFPEENQSQIVQVRVCNVSMDFQEWLKQKKVFVNSDMENGDCILRIGIHYYNNEEDVEWLLSALLEIIEKQSRLC